MTVLTKYSRDGRNICFAWLRHYIGRLRHYIGRLGQHVKCTKVVFDGIGHLPGELDGLMIRPVPSASSRDFPLTMTEKVLNGIAGRMFSADQQAKAKVCHEQLMTTDRCLPEGLLATLKKVCPLRTYVHIELLLVDHAQCQNMKFVGGNKYIGCSKSACYCCYRYIQALSMDYKLSLPACHNKMYLARRLPDIPRSRGESKGKARERIMNRMIESLRADSIEQIDKCGKRAPHFDSTTGVTRLLYDGPIEHLFVIWRTYFLPVISQTLKI